MNFDKFKIFINSHPNYIEDIFDQKDFRLVKVSKKIPSKKSIYSRNEKLLIEYLIFVSNNGLRKI